MPMYFPPVLHSALVSTFRRNLMERPGYTPYCGADKCRLHWPRTSFNGKQFECGCGWQSGFESEFIAEYVNKNTRATAP